MAEPGAGPWPTLSLAGIVKTWPGATSPVLDGVDLRLAAGSLALVEGDNGAGKTTLLRVVSRLLAADAGEVRVAGIRAEEDRVAYHRELGIVAAGNTGLYARLSPLQHLEFSARLQLVPPAQRATAIADALRAFGLSGLARARVDRLSMGQRQRVRLALAFLHQPALVLLDEPTTSLDAEGRAMLTAMVTAHLADGRAALWCLPTAEPAPVVATLRLRLARGRLAPA